MKNVFVKNLYKHIPLSECCGREAEDFTPLVADNIEMLSAAVSLELTVDGTEAKKNEDAPKRSIDIWAHDETDTAVIIENQYGAADHKHFGKTMLYYLPPFGKTVKHIWVAEDFDAAVISAINFYNELGLHIYAVKAEALHSTSTDEYTIKFTCLVSPDADEPDDIQTIKNTAKDLTKVDEDKVEANNKTFDTVASALGNLHWVARSIDGSGVCFSKLETTNKGLRMYANVSSRNNEIRVIASTDKSRNSDRTYPGVMTIAQTVKAAIGCDYDNIDTDARKVYFGFNIKVADIYNLTVAELDEIKDKFYKVYNQIKK